MEVYIQDETAATVPAGETGEIVVRSRFLAQGYWNNPDLTAKAFEADPLDGTVRIYRTGISGAGETMARLNISAARDAPSGCAAIASNPFKLNASSSVNPESQMLLCCCMTAAMAKNPV
jgi:acyl-CoA synthetase (AMP-forming)/AMP-acid ligase II